MTFDNLQRIKNTLKNDNDRPIDVKTASKIKYSLEQPMFSKVFTILKINTQTQNNLLLMT